MSGPIYAVGLPFRLYQTGDRDVIVPETEESQTFCDKTIFPPEKEKETFKCRKRNLGGNYESRLV